MSIRLRQRRPVQQLLLLRSARPLWGPRSPALPPSHGAPTPLTRAPSPLTRCPQNTHVHTCLHWTRLVGQEAPPGTHGPPGQTAAQPITQCPPARHLWGGVLDGQHRKVHPLVSPPPRVFLNKHVFYNNENTSTALSTRRLHSLVKPTRSQALPTLIMPPARHSSASAAFTSSSVGTARAAPVIMGPTGSRRHTRCSVWGSWCQRAGRPLGVH